MQTSFRACIFDLDGTLVDSLADLAAAVNLTLEKADFPPHPVQAYRDFVGSGLERLIRRALPGGEQAAHEPGLVCALMATMRVHYDTHWHDQSQVYPGIREMLTGLAQRGLDLAVLSNKPDDWACDFIKHFLPEIPFLAVRGACPGVPHKPDPTSALDLAALMNVRPEQILFVGDSAVDIHTARNAGMRSAGVCWGFRPEEELRAAGADALLHSPEELLGLPGISSNPLVFS